ncbi:hypothetical protein ACP6JC_003082 [Aspergillus fumigatus]
MMDLQKRPPQYPSLFGTSHDPRAAPQPPPTYSVPPPQQVYYDSMKQHGIPSSQPANTMAYPYSTPMSSAPPTAASSTPYNMSAAPRVDNQSYQVPQIDYEPSKRHQLEDHNKRHRHSRNNSHDQLISREVYPQVVLQWIAGRYAQAIQGVNVASRKMSKLNLRHNGL